MPFLCVHLQPIQDAMAALGIAVWQHHAECRFDPRGLSPDLHYYFGYAPERYANENPNGAIACRICKGNPLFVFHPEDSPADAPAFKARV